MSKKTTVISALTFLVAQVGVAPSSLAKQALSTAAQCEGILQESNRAVLREQLELLLDEDPNHECIPLIVGLLGGVPFASAAGGDGDRSDDIDRESVDSNVTASSIY